MDLDLESQPAWRKSTSVRYHGDWKPFAGAIAIFALAFAGLAYSLFPYVIIDRMTIWEAAAHPSSLGVVFAGAAVVLPFIVGYNVLAYRIFGGKVKAGLYQH